MVCNGNCLGNNSYEWRLGMDFDTVWEAALLVAAGLWLAAAVSSSDKLTENNRLLHCIVFLLLFIGMQV